MAIGQLQNSNVEILNDSFRIVFARVRWTVERVKLTENYMRHGEAEEQRPNGNIEIECELGLWRKLRRKRCFDERKPFDVHYNV